MKLSFLHQNRAILIAAIAPLFLAACQTHDRVQYRPGKPYKNFPAQNAAPTSQTQVVSGVVR